MAEAPSPRESEDEADCHTLQPRIVMPSSGSDGARAMEAFFQSIAPGSLVSAQRNQLDSGAPSTSGQLVESSEKKEFAMLYQGGDGDKSAILAQNNPGTIIGNQKNVYKNCIFPQASAESKRLHNLIASTHQQLETSWPQGYVKTPALDAITQHLEDKGVCLLLGPAGFGKTTQALQAMARIAADHNMQPVCLERPDDWQHLPGERDVTAAAGNNSPPKQAQAGQSDSTEKPTEVPRSRRYVVVVEDMFGKSNLIERRFEDWEEKLPAMMAKVRTGQVKLIMTSRTHIFQQCQDKLKHSELFQNLGTVQLQEEKYWNESCEIEILQAFLKQHGVETEIPVRELREAYSCQSIGFPLCCRCFASSPQAQQLGVRFFQNPLASLQDDFRALKQSDTKAYFVLILTVMQNGHLSEGFLSDDSDEMERKLVAARKVSGFSANLNAGEIRSKAHSLCGVYLTKSYDGDGYRLSHWCLSDCLIVEMCQTNLKLALDVCSLGQLCEYIRTEGCSQSKDAIVHVVRAPQYATLASRIIEEFISGQNIQAALRHPCLEDEKFLKAILKNISKEQRDALLRKNLPVNVNIGNSRIFTLKTLAAFFILERKKKMAKHLLDSDEMKILPDSYRGLLLQEALIAACFSSDVSLVQQLLRQKVSVPVEAVKAACTAETEKVDLLKTIYQKIAAVDEKRTFFAEAALICCLKEKVQSFEYLLHEAPKPDDFTAAISLVMTRLFEITHPGALFSQGKLLHAKRLTNFFEALTSAGAKVDPSVTVGIAAFHQNSFVLEELIKNGAECGAVDSSGMLPLLSAASSGSDACLRVIIDDAKSKGKPIDVNCKNLIGKTPLHVAAERNHAASVNILLQNGADPNAVDNLGRLPLHLCAGPFPDQKLDVLMCLLGKTNNPLHQDHQGKTPLHIAAERCDYSAMKLLLDQDAQREKKSSKKACDVEDYLKMRPLHVHCRQVHHPAMKTEEKRREVEKILVEKSSDINAQDLAGKTALHLAAENSDLPLLQILLENNARPDIQDFTGATAVHSLCGSKVDTAVRQRKKQILKMMLERKVDINVRDARGRTPLLLAAEADSNLVSILLQHKARTDAADEDNSTVFHFLARHKFQPHDKRLPMSRIFPGSSVDLGLLGKLITSEKDLNAKDVEGNTALHIAALNGNHALLEEFIKRGARVDILNNNKQSALHVFCCRVPWNDTEQTLKVFTLLKDRGGDLNAQDKQLCTPLHVAALNHDFSAIEALLDLKVDTGALNANDELSLHMYALGSSQNPYACWSVDEIGQAERQLVVATKNINQQNHQGSTSLHCAAQTKRFLFIKALLDNGADANIANSLGHYGLHAYASAPQGFWDSLEPNSDLRGEVENLLLQETSSLNILTKEDESPLHLATQSGCWTLLNALLDQEADADLTDKLKRKPIHHLASRILPETNPAISLLVEKTKDVNYKDRDENTPLHVAAAHCNLPVARALMKAGADVALHNSKKQSPLHLCAEAEPSASKVELGKLLLSCGPTVINDQDAVGLTALHIASSRVDISFMALLLQKDAMIDIPNAKGETAVHTLAKHLAAITQTQRLLQTPTGIRPALTAICKLVVGKTENANAKDSNGRTSLHLAAASRNLALTEILLESQAGLDICDDAESLPLHLYASSVGSATSGEDDQKLCSLLVKNTKDVNSKNTNGNTPLHLAIDSRNLLVSHSLLEDQRTNLEVANNDKELPIHRYARMPFVTNAEEWVHVETLLISRTKNIEVRNAQEQAPLHLAVCFGNLSFMKLLLENHADANALDVNSRTPLHLFANQILRNPSPSPDFTEERKRLETLLIEKTHDINKQDDAGWSPLHHAVQAPASSLVASLLKGSARTDLVNSEKRTALHIRAVTPHMKFGLAGFTQIPQAMECDKMLIEKSRNLDVQDNDGKTPLHLALASGNYPMAELLLHNIASVNIQDNKKHSALHILAGTFLKSFLHETTSGDKGTGRNQSDLQAAADADTKSGSAPELKDTRGDFARLIFQSTEDVNRKNEFGQTALHLAAATKDFTVIEILLKGNARTDVKDANRRTALHTYAAALSLATVDPIQRRQIDELIVSKTQDLNATDVAERTPLHYAAERDDLHLMQTLLRNGAKTDVPEKESVLLLYSRRFCTESTRAEVSEMREHVDDLLVRNADDVDVTDENENTPLHIAAGRDDLHLMETLLKHGASCNLKTKEGSTCLHVHAARSDLWKAVNDAAMSMLSPDHRRNRVEELLIKKTKEINAQTSAPPRGSPLQIAASLGKLTLAEKLLKRNAGTDVLDDNSMTPLHIYASRSRLGEVGVTPTLSPSLQDAWLALRFRVDRLMVERAADINALTKTNDTALHLAAQCDDLSLMEELLKRGASADVQNKDGALALHLFAARTRAYSEFFKQKRRPVSKVLVERTAKVNVKDREGRSPLDLAKKDDDFLLIQLLSDRGEM